MFCFPSFIYLKNNKKNIKLKDSPYSVRGKRICPINFNMCLRFKYSSIVTLTAIVWHSDKSYYGRGKKSNKINFLEAENLINFTDTMVIKGYGKLDFCICD